MGARGDAIPEDVRRRGVPGVETGEAEQLRWLWTGTYFIKFVIVINKTAPNITKIKYLKFVPGL